MDDIEAIREEWQGKLTGLRSDSTARRVAELAISHPVMNYELVTRELGVAPPTAFRALEMLVERGVLAQANSQRRNRVWLAGPVLGALDDFAARAGRRRLGAPK